MTFVNFPYAAVATIVACVVGLMVTILATTWKLSKLLAPIPSIQQALHDLNIKVGIQNGRVSRLEEWKELMMEMREIDARR